MTAPRQSLAVALEARYRIERELGRGAMATVVLAEDLKHGRKVAIKVLLPEVAAALGHDRFLREIEIVARLTHPHILPLHDSGAANGELYYVTPYIEGESLRARLEREKQLPVVDAIRLAREIANGLGHAHHRGVVHRDVKPENVLLADGVALVADFGIARPIQTDLRMTAPGASLGTPLYMAPEQITGSSDVDARADLYALGCVLYEMLAGRPPFSGPTWESLAYQHLSVEPPPLTDLRPDAPPGLVTVLAKALAKAPADRFATAARFADALGVSTIETLLPARREAAAVPNNLPRERTSFIGREGELTECARLLGESRLLTIVGVGGCGKTRLALKLAASLLEAHPDGTWFVDLAPVQSPERVTQSVAAALGLKEEPEKALAATLAHHLEAKRALLVLDNCEHLLTACAELVDALLSSCPDLKLVATSREGLGVQGERSYALRPLSVPSVSAQASREEIEASESVQLFVDRAHMVAPDFTLNAATAPAVSEICRRLDGIPLAIELAATRTKLLSLEQIRAKLGDRFRLLTGGSKALARHQTLRATIQWSYDHLTAELQRLLEALAVFEGGWTLEAAAAVRGAGSDEFEVLDLMTGLVDKSLVVVGREGGMPRYRMLETIRQFAQERLSESGQGDAARGRHLDFYLALVEEAEAHLSGPQQDAWLRRLDHEMENVLGAHAWCDRVEGGAEKGLRIAAGMPLFWIARGRFNLGLRTTREAVARGPSESPTRARGRALLAGGWLAIRIGDHEGARAFVIQSIPISLAVEDPSAVSRGLSILGIATFAGGDPPAAHRHLEQAVESAEGIDKVTALNCLALIVGTQGDNEQSRSLHEQALTISRGLGSIVQTTATLENLALAKILLNQHAAARANLLEAFELGEKAALVASRQGVLEITSVLAAAVGEPDRAARLWGAADALLDRIGMRRNLLKEQALIPWVGRMRDGLGEPGFDAAYVAGRALPDDVVSGEVRAWLGGAEERDGAGAVSGGMRAPDPA